MKRTYWRSHKGFHLSLIPICSLGFYAPSVKIQQTSKFEVFQNGLLSLWILRKESYYLSVISSLNKGTINSHSLFSLKEKNRRPFVFHLACRMSCWTNYFKRVCSKLKPYNYKFIKKAQEVNLCSMKLLFIETCCVDTNRCWALGESWL